MTAIPNSPDAYLEFYASGSATPVKAPGPHGTTLTNGTTYYVEAGGDAALIQSVQFDWDATIVITSITLEDSNWDIGTGTGQASTSQAAGRAWCPENPSTGYVGVVGGTFTAATFTVSTAGGTAGNCLFHIGNTGARRNRWKIVVGGTGGNMNARSHAKM